MHISTSQFQAWKCKVRGESKADGLGNDFLNLTPKVKATSARISKWDYINLKNFCTEKKTNNKMKRHLEQGKIFVSHISDKGLISKIHKQFIQLNSKKKPQKTPTKQKQNTIILKNGQRI